MNNGLEVGVVYTKGVQSCLERAFVGAGLNQAESISESTEMQA